MKDKFTNHNLDVIRRLRTPGYSTRRLERITNVLGIAYGTQAEECAGSVDTFGENGNALLEQLV